METITLNNGVKCPVIGIGTFMLSPRRGARIFDSTVRGFSLCEKLENPKGFQPWMLKPASARP